MMKATLIGVAVVSMWCQGSVTHAGDDCPTEESGFAGGDGSESSPYLVCDPVQLQRVDEHLEAGTYFLQTADIDMTGFTFTPIGEASFGGPPQFFGVYDGGGYSILNLEINAPSTDVIGLFGKTGEGSEVRNVGLQNVNLIGSLCVAGIAAENNGWIRNCFVTGSVQGNVFIGGLLGDNRADMENCYCLASVSGTSDVGGVVGVHFGSGLPTVNNCYAAGPIEGDDNTGGLVGRDLGSSAVVTDSFWDTETTGQNSSIGGTGLPTTQMQMQTTFDPPWDFDNIWTIDEGNDYPRLWYESDSGGQPGDGDNDGDVDLFDFASMLDCLTGPGGVLDPGCEPFDFDADADTDRTDAAAFQRAFTGAL
jgi:hypothetical protein